MSQNTSAVYKSTISNPNSVMIKLGGSPGQVVMGDNSCPKGCGFKSRRHILDGIFSHWFAVKIVLMFEKTENKRKRSRGPFLKKRDLVLKKWSPGQTFQGQDFSNKLCSFAILFDLIFNLVHATKDTMSSYFCCGLT